MYTIASDREKRRNSFATVAEPFLQQSGLPFAQVLTGEGIERAFAQRDSEKRREIAGVEIAEPREVGAQGTAPIWTTLFQVRLHSVVGRMFS